MYKVKYTLLLFFCSLTIAQDQEDKVKRKVYRTQTGSIIEAPQPLFERAKEKAKLVEKISKNAKPKILKRTEKVESTYRNELDSLKRTVKSLLNQSNLLQKNYEQKLSEKQTDTIFVYTTIYDTTTVLDTSYIYTNATTTVYDTVVIIDSVYINQYDTTTLIQTNYDTVYVMDTTVVVNYDTTVMKDTIWAFAYDTTYIKDTTWVFAHDTTVIRDSIWLFAVDSIKSNSINSVASTVKDSGYEIINFSPNTLPLL